MTDLQQGILFTVLGALLSAVIGLVFYRRGGGARSKVRVGLAELAHIDPSTVGVRVEMRVGGRDVSNLLVLEVQVGNAGPRDVVVPDAGDPEKQGLRPRILLPSGVTALADPWNPSRSTARGDVRVARSLVDGRQALFVHIHRLAARTQVTARVVCTYSQAGAPQAWRQGIDFEPGFLQDVSVVGVGSLA